MNSRSARLWSLWDMLLNYAQAFAILSADVEKLRAQILIESRDTQLSFLQKDMPRVAKLIELMQRLLATCNQVPALDRMAPPIGRMLANLDSGTDPNALHHAVDHLQLQLFDELNRLKLFLVNEHLVDLYEQEMPFGELVFNSFPSAIPDTRNAGRCLALEQPTAAMFHLMRVMEHGLNAYAAKLGIPYAPSWEAYIRQLEKAFAVDWNQKTKAWKTVESFHKQIMGDIVAVKIAWRNPTIHIVNDYEQQEALTAYFAVQKFMQNLAEKVKEPKRRRSA